MIYIKKWTVVPSSDKLALFKLLNKINSVRNIFAHEELSQIDFSKINQTLINLLKNSFVLSREIGILDTLTRFNKEGGIVIPVTIIKVTNMMFRVITEMETLGKDQDTTLKSYETLRQFSSLQVRRRFTILLYQFETGVKSQDSPDEFKEKEAFDEIISETKDIFMRFFKK